MKEHLNLICAAVLLPKTWHGDNKVKNASIFQLAFNIQPNCIRLRNTHTHTWTHTNSVRQFMTMAFHMSMLLIVPLLLYINTDISQLADTPRIYMTLIKWIPTYVFSLHADTNTNHSLFLSNHTTERHQQGLFNRSQETARNMALCLDAVWRTERMNVVERYTNVNEHVRDVWVCVLMLRNTACILRLHWFKNSFS